MQEQETFNPMLQSWHSKIDLPTPNPMILYCIRKIENFPEREYCYMTVLVDRAGSPYQTVLFFNYQGIENYGRPIEDLKKLVPLHFSEISDDLLVTFNKATECPCGLKG